MCSKVFIVFHCTVVIRLNGLVRFVTIFYFTKMVFEENSNKRLKLKKGMQNLLMCKMKGFKSKTTLEFLALARYKRAVGGEESLQVMTLQDVVIFVFGQCAAGSCHRLLACFVVEVFDADVRGALYRKSLSTIV